MTGEAEAPTRGRTARLFVAFDVPDTVKRAASVAAAPWRERFPDVRWVPEANLHVTLAFIGSTPLEDVDPIGDLIVQAATRAPPFRTRLDGLGAFPSPRRARVLWAGVADRDGIVADLAAVVGRALGERVARERRPFHPHLTLARASRPLSLPDIDSGTPLRSRRFEVRSICLYRSRPGRPAPVYEALRPAPLGG